jgi:hypothetical protein
MFVAQQIRKSHFLNIITMSNRLDSQSVVFLCVDSQSVVFVCVV